jgi:hypothetical protein
MLSPAQMGRLSVLGLECIYDVYFAEGPDDHAG